MTKSEFLVKLSEHPNDDRRMDYVFDLFDGWFQLEHFGKADALISNLDPVELTETDIVAVLCISHIAAKNGNLPSYHSFYKQCANLCDPEVTRGFYNGE